MIQIELPFIKDKNVYVGLKDKKNVKIKVITVALVRCQKRTVLHLSDLQVSSSSLAKV